MTAIPVVSEWPAGLRRLLPLDGRIPPGPGGPLSATPRLSVGTAGERDLGLNNPFSRIAIADPFDKLRPVSRRIPLECHCLDADLERSIASAVFSRRSAMSSLRFKTNWL